MSNINTSAETRNLRELDRETENLYESIAIVAKRANQMSAKIREEINGKLQEFNSINDNLEEVFENREQIEMSKSYERMPKPSLLALKEFMAGQVYYSNPDREQVLDGESLS
jgi:DNA-directed RNA polymerase subunit K/omega